MVYQQFTVGYSGDADVEYESGKLDFHARKNDKRQPKNLSKSFQWHCIMN